jgi:hypothetical protein
MGLRPELAELRGTQQLVEPLLDDIQRLKVPYGLVGPHTISAARASASYIG